MYNSSSSGMLVQFSSDRKRLQYLRVVHQLLVESAGGQEAVEVLAVDTDVELLPCHAHIIRKGIRERGKKGNRGRKGEGYRGVVG